MDSAGNAIAVWIRNNGSTIRLWATRYSAERGWEDPQIIDNASVGWSINPRIAFDTAGNAIVVWEQSDSVQTDIWAIRYTPATGWGQGENIEAKDPVRNPYPAGAAFQPNIFFDGSGNAIAIWFQSDGKWRNIWTNRYSPENGWATATLLDNSIAGDAGDPSLAIDDAGNAVAIWTQESLVGNTWRKSIWTSRFDFDGGWEIPYPLTSNLNRFTGYPDIAFDKEGRATAVWSEAAPDDSISRIWTCTYSYHAGWSSPSILNKGSGGTSSASKILFDFIGNPIVVWLESDEKGNRSLWSVRGSRYVRGAPAS